MQKGQHFPAWETLRRNLLCRYGICTTRLHGIAGRADGDRFCRASPLAMAHAGPFVQPSSLPFAIRRRRGVRPRTIIPWHRAVKKNSGTGPSKAPGRQKKGLKENKTESARAGEQFLNVRGVHLRQARTLSSGDTFVC